MNWKESTFSGISCNSTDENWNEDDAIVWIAKIITSLPLMHLSLLIWPSFFRSNKLNTFWTSASVNMPDFNPCSFLMFNCSIMKSSKLSGNLIAIAVAKSLIKRSVPRTIR